MPKEKSGKPTVESVQDRWPLSEFLTVEVSEKKKAELDKILICTPDIVEPQICRPAHVICRPSLLCIPRCIPVRFPCIPVCKPYICKPYFICKPRIICSPDVLGPIDWGCTPEIVTTPIQPEEIYELYGEMKEMFTALENVKQEIAEIKKRIK